MGVSESHTIDEKLYGFRIYKLIENGPLHLAGVKELEDFIIPPTETSQNKIPFYEYIRNNAGRKIKFNIYSLSKRIFYTVDITIGNNEKAEGFLGATVRYENWSTADKNLLRVIRVKENSLAQKDLNLIPSEDFVIALRPDFEDIFTLNKDDLDPLTNFSNMIDLYENKSVEFFIYNIKRGARSAKAILTSRGTGEILGCDVAYGKLHEFPKVVNSDSEEEESGNERNSLGGRNDKSDKCEKSDKNKKKEVVAIDAKDSTSNKVENHEDDILVVEEKNN
jgi:hypothetical protein